MDIYIPQGGMLYIAWGEDRYYGEVEPFTRDYYIESICEFYASGFGNLFAECQKSADAGVFVSADERPEKIYRTGDALENKMSIPYGEPRHVFADGYEYGGQPIVISEFGGIAFSADGDKGWGYGNLAQNEEAYLNRLRSLVLAVKNMRGVCSYCLTQTTDVQQEVNGVLTEDRKWKMDVKKLKEINDM